MFSINRRSLLLGILSMGLGVLSGSLVPADLVAGQLHRSSGRIAKGTTWETPYYEIRADATGPTVMIVGGVHGNEPAGAYAAEQIRHWSIGRGTLIVLPCANRPGRAANTRYLPNQPMSDRDLNRNFPSKSRPSLRGSMAAAIWELTLKVKPDWVLDLHEGYEFNVSHKPPKGKKRSVGTSLIYLRSEANRPLVNRLLKTVNQTITDKDRRFVPLGRGPVEGSWVRACLRELKIPGMILETTFKDQPLSLRARQHRLLVNEILDSLKMLEESQVPTLVDPAARKFTVGIFDGPGASSGGVQRFIKLIGKEADMQCCALGPEDITPGILDQFNVVLFPGGSGSRQGRAIGQRGRGAVRKFIASGGGCVGVCAGAYLCSAYYPWSLKVIDTAVFTGSREIKGVGRKQMWYRGKSTSVQIELTADGKKFFTGLPASNAVRYHNGPIVSAMWTGWNDPLLPDYTVLAHFRTETGLYPPQEGTMINTPAIVAAPFGRGRVVSISPHPESTPGLQEMIGFSIRWTRKHSAPKPPGPRTPQSR
jgi:glutamine amidotransferase-like uncharacterized protein